MRSDRRVKKAHLDGRMSSGAFSIQELPSLKCSIIEPGDNTKPSGPEDIKNVDWNELLVRESIPGDYGTIQPTDTARQINENLQEQDDNPIVKTFE